MILTLQQLQQGKKQEFIFNDIHVRMWLDRPEYYHIRTHDHGVNLRLCWESMETMHTAQKEFSRQVKLVLGIPRMIAYEQVTLLEKIAASGAAGYKIITDTDSKYAHYLKAKGLIHIDMDDDNYLATKNINTWTDLCEENEFNPGSDAVRKNRGKRSELFAGRSTKPNTPQILGKMTKDNAVICSALMPLRSVST